MGNHTTLRITSYNVCYTKLLRGGIDARAPEGVDDLEPLGELLPLGDRTGGPDVRPQLIVFGIQVDAFQQLLDRFSPDPGFELVAVLL